MYKARRKLALGAALLVALIGFSPAVASAAQPNSHSNQVTAQNPTDAIANALLASPVYVSPSANSAGLLSQSQAAQLVTQIRGNGKPIDVVVLTQTEAQAIGSPAQLLANVHISLGKATSQVIAVSTGKN